jgi:transcriptional regulator with PAS, ATPase and Fis domain
VAATNRDLRDLVAENKLREDLYYRLAMINVTLPRLSERREDLPLLQRHFLDRFSTQYNKPTLHLTRKAQAVISGYTCPGNIRELENVLGYCAMMAEHDMIDVRDLPEYLQVYDAPTVIAPEENNVLLSLKELELRHVHRVLEHVQGSRAKAAEILGISRTTLYRILEKRSEGESLTDEANTPAQRPL